MCMAWDLEINKSFLKVDAYGGCLVKTEAVLRPLFPGLLFSTFKLPWFVETSKAITPQSGTFTWQDN